MTDTAILEAMPPIHEKPAAQGLAVVSIAKSYDKRVVLTDVSVTVGRGPLRAAQAAGVSSATRCTLTSASPGRMSPR